MKYISVSNTQRKMVVDDKNYERMVQPHWRLNGNNIQAWIDGEFTSNGRFLLEIKDPKKVADHRDRDSFNCLESNLREATYAQNRVNSRKNASKYSSQFKGVCWHIRQKKWIAQIKVNGKMIFLGYFTAEILAAKAYDKSASFHFGDYAILNFPDEKEIL